MYSKTSTRSNRVRISTDKDYLLRLQFPSALSKQLYGKRQFFKSLGRQDTPENRKWAEGLAARIQADIDHPDADVRNWLGNETPFSERESLECAYKLSEEYRTLFDRVYGLARGLVKDEDSKLSHAQRRGRYWSALAIIRCVMSSPAAAISTLSRQLDKDSNLNAIEEINEELAANQVYDSTETERVIDFVPASVIESVKQTYSDSQRRKLREFVKAAEELQGSKQDSKLQQLK